MDLSDLLDAPEEVNKTNKKERPRGVLETAKAIRKRPAVNVAKSEQLRPSGEERKKRKLQVRRRNRQVRKLVRELMFATAKPRSRALRPTNFVCTAEALTAFRLSVVAHLVHGRFKRSAFPSCTARVMDPHVTVSIFDTGRLVTTGAKSPRQGQLALLLLLRHLSKKLQRPLRVYNWKLRNVVGSGGLGKLFDAERFYRDHKEHCEYAPLEFPGLRYVVGIRKMHIVLFPSGMYLVTGATSEAELHEAFAKIGTETLFRYCEGGDRYTDESVRRLVEKCERKLATLHL